MYEDRIANSIARIKRHFREPEAIKQFLGKSLYLLPIAIFFLLLKGNYHTIIDRIDSPFLTELYYAFRAPLQRAIDLMWLLLQFAVLLDALVLSMRFCFITVFAITFRTDVICEFVTRTVSEETEQVAFTTVQEYILFKQRLIS